MLQQKRKFSPAAAGPMGLLLAACRVFAGRVDGEPSAPLSSALPNHAALLAAAKAHGLFGILYSFLQSREEGREVIFFSDVRAAALREEALALTALRELSALRQCAAKDGIPLLPFKGTALLPTIYGGRGGRGVRDLDVLLKSDHVEAVLKMMFENGYRERHGLDISRSSLLLRRGGSLELSHPQRRLPVDLHTRVVDPQFHGTVPLSRLFAAAQGTSDLSALEEQVIPAELHFFCLLAHGSKHLWRRLIWLVDTVLLVDSLNAAADELAERAAEFGLRRQFSVWNILQSRLLSRPLLEERSARAGLARRNNLLTHLICSQWNRRRYLPFFWRSLFVQLGMSAHGRAAVRYCALRLFLPREADMIQCSSSHPLTRLMLRRPLRLASASVSRIRHSAHLRRGAAR
jgi:hypothetical protein